MSGVKTRDKGWWKMRGLIMDVPAEKGGALTIIRSFYDHLDRSANDDEWVFVLSAPLFAPTKKIDVISKPWIKRSWLHRLIWDYFCAPRLAGRYRPDIVISFQNLSIPTVKIPQIVYVHQPLPFTTVKRFSLWRRDERLLAVYQRFIGRLIVRSLRRAAAIVVQTEWMRTALRQKVGREPPAGIHVISPPVPPSRDEPGEFQRARTNGRFLYPTSPFAYKNLECIVHAAALLLREGLDGFEVAWTVRGDENHYIARIRREAAFLGDRVRYLGQIPREELEDWYRRSVLVFPSYVESFGLPLLEARRAGSIILAADMPFAREILHGYGNVHYFDPFSPESLAELMAGVLRGKIVPQPGGGLADDTAYWSDGWTRLLKIAAELAG